MGNAPEIHFSKRQETKEIKTHSKESFSVAFVFWQLLKIYDAICCFSWRCRLLLLLFRMLMLLLPLCCDLWQHVFVPSHLYLNILAAAIDVFVGSAPAPRVSLKSINVSMSFAAFFFVLLCFHLHPPLDYR